MDEDPLLTKNEVGYILNVSPRTVEQWRHRSARQRMRPPFPDPDREVGGNRVGIWDLATIETWARAANRWDDGCQTRWQRLADGLTVS